MSTETYLGTVEDPSLWGTVEPTLVLFLESGREAPVLLSDPQVISAEPALGRWRLLAWDAGTRRAFYEPDRYGPAVV